MQKRKLVVYLMAGAMLATSMPVTAYAEPAAGTQGIESSSLVDDKTSATVPVQYTVDATFTVKLPSAITLSNTDGSWGYSGTVGVKGDIDAGKVVSVTPDDSMTLYDVTNRLSEEVPAGENDQNYPHKDAKDADVMQKKTSFAWKEINADTYTDTDLVLTAGTTQSGKWRGTLPVEITYGDVGTEPGLYADDSTMIKSWGLIKSEGIVHVSNGGELTTNYNVDTDTNASSGTLNGSLVLDDEVISLGDNALNNCDSLTSVTIPETVTSIGGNALKGCDSLTEVSYEGTRDQWESVSKGDGWSDGISVGTVTCSDGDAVIDTGAAGLYGSDGSFTPWSTLVSDGKITVTDNVIQSNSDTSMEGRLVIEDGITSLGNSAFRSCRNLKNVSIPESVTSIGSSAFYGCSKLTNINIPDDVTSIGISTFKSCCSLTSITIPDGVTSIGGSAFESCYGLTSITIPGSVTSIGEYGTFAECTRLESIHIPDGVTSIGDDAFKKCSSLTSINIPDGVTSIGNEAFWNCAGLTSINIPNSVTSIGSSAFNNCSGLKSITIPDGVTSIRYQAFQGCSGLTSVTIPDSVTSIERYAFNGCSGLTSITIPSSVTSIGDNAFNGCSGLTSITIPDGVTSIGYSVFGDCTHLSSINIPDGVTSIGHNAFNRCSGLTSIAIPDSVTSIGKYVFGSCTSLTSITFTGTQEQWNAITKGNKWNNNVPTTVVHCTDGDVTL